MSFGMNRVELIGRLGADVNPAQGRGPPLRCAPFRPGLAGQRRWRA